MFGIGFSELVLLALVAVVLIKPDDLPGFFRKAGKFYGKVKAAYKEVVAVKEDFLREMEVGAAVGESAESTKKADSKSPPDASGVAVAAPSPEPAKDTLAARPDESVEERDNSSPID